MYKYDLIISLGSGCHMADTLKRLGITEKTYPFDWSDCDGDASERLLKKCNLIKNHFKNALDKKDFVEYHTLEPKTRGVKNIKTGIHYIHDFPWEKSVKDFFPEFLKKFERRIKRLYEDINNANNILFVYYDISAVMPLKAAKDAIKILKESFPNKKIQLLILLPLISNPNMKYHKIKAGIKDVSLVACSNRFGDLKTVIFLLSQVLEQALGNDYYSFIMGDDIICSGLSLPEETLRWSNAEMAFFRLQTNLKTEKVCVHIRCIPFVNKKRLTQNVKIMCNGCPIEEMSFNEYRIQTISVTVPNNNMGSLDFVFEFDNLASPKELGLSEDDRKIALGFIDAIISEK